MGVTVRSATRDDLPTASRVLAEAFHDDPVKAFLAGVGPGEEIPISKALTFFGVFTKMQLHHGLLDIAEIDSVPAGVSVWAPPGEWKVPFGQIVRNAHRFVRIYGLRFFPNLRVLSTLERAHPTEPHYYLEFIGTTPAQQGKGAGAALLTPMLERCDAEGVGAYLESSKESNVAFYRRFGFEVTTEIVHRGAGAPRQWLMWRDPRP